MKNAKECTKEPSSGKLAVKAAMEAELSDEARMAISPSPKLI